MEDWKEGREYIRPSFWSVKFFSASRKIGLDGISMGFLTR